MWVIKELRIGAQVSRHKYAVSSMILGISGAESIVYRFVLAGWRNRLLCVSVKQDTAGGLSLWLTGWSVLLHH